MVRDKGNDFDPANGENGWSEEQRSRSSPPPGGSADEQEALFIPEEEGLALPEGGDVAFSDDDLKLSEEELTRSRRPETEAASSRERKAEPRMSAQGKPESLVAVASPKASRSASARSTTLRRGVRDAVDQLWASVFFSPEQTAPKSVVVTAAEPREGVSQIATALALAGCAAERGLRIALVDFNLRRPMLHRILGLQSSPGVVEVLAGQKTLAAAAQRLEEGRLGVLVAGQVQGVAPSHMQRQNVGALVRDLAAVYDHVIIDAPPVNTQATVQALAGCTDGVLLVTKATVTRRESVAEARKRVELAHGKVIGLVLNQRRFPIPGFLYRRM